LSGIVAQAFMIDHSDSLRDIKKLWRGR